MKGYSIAGRRLVALATGFAATAAIGLGGASAALATEGANIVASGSPMQSTAQGVWVSGWPGFTRLTNSPMITYSPTSNDEGLSQFGNNSGKLKVGVDGLDAYTATDDAPSASEIADAESASGSEEITLPVTQEPVVVLLSLPTGISNLERGGTAATSVDLTNGLLAGIWNDEVPASSSPAYGANTWGALLTDAGYTFSESGGTHGGAQAITLRASESGSGTNYAFKQYLSQLTSAYSGYVNDENLWPITVTKEGGGSATEAQKTAERPGSIGYSYLVDAVAADNGGYSGTPTSSTFGESDSHLIAYAMIQNNGLGSESPVYASPVQEDSAVPNVDMIYSIGISGTSGKVGHWADPGTADGSWEGTYASDPDVYGAVKHIASYYPIVAVTYDLAWANYATSKLAFEYGGSAEAATKVGNTVFDYLTYVLESSGQFAVENEYYAPLPPSVQVSTEFEQLSAVNGGS